MTVRNTILSNAPSENCFQDFGTLVSSGNNLSNETTCAFALTAPGDLNNTNPQLGALANNGGLTQTHALLAGSPAINAAGGCPPPATDQRGVVRPQGSACDIDCTRPAARRVSVLPSATSELALPPLVQLQ